MARAIEIAGVVGRDGLVVRLRQRDQLMHAHSEVERLGRKSNITSIDRWENEGGAIRT